MADQLDPHEAARALAQIRANQERVIDESAAPLGFSWAIAALYVMFGVANDAAAELGRPVLIRIGFGLFVLGVVIAVGWVLRRSLRVKPRGLYGRAAAVVAVGYGIVMIGGQLGVVFLLKALDVKYSGTLGGLAMAVLMVGLAPLLNNSLRRVMLAHRSPKL